MRTPRSGLDPVRTPRLPRRGTVWRGAVVMALLLAAAGVWFGVDGADPAPAPATTSASPAASPAPPVDPDRVRLAVPAGLVGVPVSLAAPTASVMLHPGDRVDLLATVPDLGDPLVLAEEATVLAVDHAGATLLLGLTTSQAYEVVSLTGAAAFAVIVRS